MILIKNLKKLKNQINKMKINNNGIELIKHFESFRSNAYLCPANVWTIGYGHTKGVKKGDKITEQEGEKLLIDDLKVYERDTLNVCNALNLEFNDNQFSALVSFCYNCGAGALKKMLTNYKNGTSIYDAMYKYRFGGGKELAGLIRRRKAEIHLFETGELKFTF